MKISSGIKAVVTKNCFGGVADLPLYFRNFLLIIIFLSPGFVVICERISLSGF